MNPQETSLNKQKLLKIFAAVSFLLLISFLFVPSVNKMVKKFLGYKFAAVYSSTASQTMPGFNGTVNTILPDNNGGVYVGGFFSYVGPVTGNGIILNANNGTLDNNFPTVNAIVRASVADDNGGWYIAGDFTSVGGIARNYLAHILSDRSVDPDFNPNVSTQIFSLALSTSTNILYLGGNFSSVGGIIRSKVAAVDATNGSVISSFNPNVNDLINSIVLSPDRNTLYIGGRFTYAGPYTGYGVPIIASSGIATSVFPEVNGRIRSVIPDSSGGWYIGGDFTTVGGVSHSRLAHILSDGSVDSSFNPIINSTVTTMTLSTSTLYIGGNFTTVSGTSINRLAAINISDGSLVSAFNPNVNNSINTIVLSTSTLYLAGSFTTVGGVSHTRVAAVNISDGSLVSAFNPTVNSDVSSSVLSEDGSTLYLGGVFSTINSTTRNGLAALNTSDGSLVSAFNPNVPSGNVMSMALSTSTNILYIGGSFSTVASVTRYNLAAVNTSNGSLVSGFNPNGSYNIANSYIYSMNFSPDRSILYLGGIFSSIGGVARSRIAAVNISDGSLTSFNPSASAAAWAINVSLDGSTIYAGGDLTSIGGSIQNQVSAINTSDGRVVNGFNPAATNGEVYSIAFSSSTNYIYLGGNFTTVGGIARNYIAALSATDGSLVSGFNPNTNSYVQTILPGISSSTIYIGGSFSTVGGVSKPYFASINPSTGSLMNGLTPNNVAGPIQSLHLSSDGNTLYIGGNFASIDSVEHSRIAAINTSDGSLVSSFNPSVDNMVRAISVSSDQNFIYVGGDLISSGGLIRNNLAHVLSDGSVDSNFNPNANLFVYSLALSTSTNILYIGGDFTSVGGVNRNRLAAVNASDGSLISGFNPNVNGTVSALVLSTSSDILYLGGTFTNVSTTTRNRIAAINTSDGSLVSGFDPNANNYIKTLVIDDSTLYIGGFFTTIGTTTINRLAAVNSSDGSLISTFNPNVNSEVATLSLYKPSNILYLAGQFTTVGGVGHNRLAAVNATSGAVYNTFNPTVNSNVSSMVLYPDGNIIYLGGGFSSINGITHFRLGAVNTSDGSTVTSFDPGGANGSLNNVSISQDNSTLYIGGSFTAMGPETHPRFAAFSLIPDVPVITHRTSYSNTESEVISTTTATISDASSLVSTTSTSTSNISEESTSTDKASTTTTVITKDQVKTTDMSKVTFTNTLQYGSVGEEVRKLQVFLNNNGFIVANTGAGSRGKETAYFGPATKAALVRFQESYSKDILTPLNLEKGTGVLWNYSRKIINKILQEQ